MQKTILITARDVGAAINIIEISRLLQENPLCKTYLHIQEPAASYFARAGLDFEPIHLAKAEKPEDENGYNLIAYAQNLIDAIKPDAILCGLSTPGDGGIDEALIAVSKAKIPSFVMQDFWGEVNDFFGACADYYLCLDATAKELTEQKYPCKGLVIGSPRHACYGEIDLANLRASLRTELDLSAAGNIIGLFGQSLHHITGYQATLQEFLSSLKDINPEAFVLYRRHPRESIANAESTQKLLKTSGMHYAILNHEKVEHSLLVCDVVISILSNCLYDAAYLNFFAEKPLITPVALCYKADILQHLTNYNMISASPYQNQKIALICNQDRPDREAWRSILSPSCQTELWQSAKNLKNPKYAIQNGCQGIFEHL